METINATPGNFQYLDVLPVNTQINLDHEAYHNGSIQSIDFVFNGKSHKIKPEDLIKLIEANPEYINIKRNPMKIYQALIELSIEGRKVPFYSKYFTDIDLAYECRDNLEADRDKLVEIATYLSDFFSVYKNIQDSKFVRRFWLFMSIKDLIEYDSFVRIYEIDIDENTKLELDYFDF